MKQHRPLRSAHVQLIAVSWNFGWPIAAGVAVGYWIDGHLGTSPVASLGLGLGAMTVSISRMIRLSQEEAREWRELEAAERAERRAEMASSDVPPAGDRTRSMKRGTRRQRRRDRKDVEPQP